jgi:6-phosphogluconolactonase
MQIFNISPTKKLILPGDFKSTVAFAAKHFIESGKAAIQDHGAFFVALSGGSTPKAIYHYLAMHYNNESLWKKTFLFWGDERAVAQTDSDSNYKMAMDSGFSKLSIPYENIFRMKAEDDIEKQAKQYDALLKKILPHGHFDLLMLGMGEDGHTASLFPSTKALDEKTAFVVANHIPQKNTWRMTLTFPVINKAHHIVFYVTGASKKHKLQEVFNDHHLKNPCSKVGTETFPALWVVDQDAGELILENLL